MEATTAKQSLERPRMSATPSREGPGLRRGAAAGGIDIRDIRVTLTVAEPARSAQTRPDSHRPFLSVV